MNKFQKLFEKLQDDIDCYIITSDVNRCYFTGVKSSSGIVIALRDKAYLIIDFRYIEKARNTITMKNEVEVIEQKNIYVQISDILKKNSVRNIAVETKYMTVSKYNMLKKRLIGNDIKIIETDILSNAIDSIRSVKDKKEITYIQKAQEITENAFCQILKFIRVGVTEREIALELDHLITKNGKGRLSFEPIVLSGENTSMPHGIPTDRKVQSGDFVLMDFGAVYNGYHSDMTRTVCVGSNPTDEMIEVYHIVLKAQMSAINAAYSGITGQDLDKISRDIIANAGFADNFGHSLGHGIGMEIHEKPNISPYYKFSIENGSVITIEPGIYIPGKFGVRIEDIVILTENGCKNLTKSEKNIIFL